MLILMLGSNIKREESIKKGLMLLQTKFSVKKISSVYETENVSDNHNQSYYNCAVMIDTDERLETIKKIILPAIENECGRKRDINDKHAPRTLDIDISFYGQQQVTKEDYQVPDPDITKYKHLLVPICEIAPQFIHPDSGKSIKSLLKDCQDKHHILKV
tara:strand:- start:559 stop:1035 length:477 start_codon:yes stop_codon:yes gene_type:complete